MQNLFKRESEEGVVCLNSEMLEHCHCPPQSFVMHYLTHAVISWSHEDNVKTIKDAPILSAPFYAKAFYWSYTVRPLCYSHILRLCIIWRAGACIVSNYTGNLWNNGAASSALLQRTSAYWLIFFLLLLFLSNGLWVCHWCLSGTRNMPLAWPGHYYSCVLDIFVMHRTELNISF